MIKIASFDVFDTVLTLPFGWENYGPIMLGKKLKILSLIECSIESFAHARLEAHERALINGGGSDSKVNLHHIYEELSNILDLTDIKREQLLKVELDLMAELIRPIPRAKELIKAARKSNQRIVFVSDMYIGTEFICKQLTRHGLYLDNDHCYVSCDYAKSKSSGQLFRELICRESISPNLVSHCGNNSWSDVESAKRIGLKVKPFSDGNFNRYENIFNSYASATDGLSSALAGASRLARLTVCASSLEQEALRDVSASLAAPVLTGFILWLLRRAQKLGLKRLYFVSRDGQLLVEIASRLIKKLDFDCEIRYLYGSRQAWLLPSLTSIDEKLLMKIFELDSESEFFSVRTILSRLNIKPDEIKEYLISIELREEFWSCNLSYQQRQTLIELIKEQKAIHEIILKKAVHKRLAMIKYLTQEGLLDETEFGFVDIGAGATLHNALSSVLATVGKKPPRSFYLQLDKEFVTTKFGIPESYMYNKFTNLGYMDFPNLFGMMEIFCMADHGTVISYDLENEQAKPILKQEYNQDIINWGYPIIRETICCFAENLLLDLNLINPYTDVRAASIKALKELSLKPSFLEAKAWGSFPFEIGINNIPLSIPLAKSYRWIDIFQVFRHGSNTNWRKDALWHEGSFTLTPPILKAALKLSMFVGKFMQSNVF